MSKKETKVNITVSPGIRLWAVSAGLALAGVICMPAMLPLGDNQQIFTNSIVSAGVFAGLFALLYHGLKAAAGKERRQWRIAAALAVGFTCCMVWGASLEEQENVVFTDGYMWISILVLSIVFTILLRWAWEKLADLPLAGRIFDPQEAAGAKGHGESSHQKEDRKYLLQMGLLLFLCWLPVFLAVYPGFFVYDAQDEYMQVVTRNFSNHHPLVHVLLLGGIIHGVFKLTGSVNLGIACYTLVQMVILAGIFAYVLLYLRQKGTAQWVRIITLLYFGFFPVIVMFNLCSAKDGLFTGMFLLVFLMLDKLCGQWEEFWASKADGILFLLAAVGLMLLRHNGKYAFLVFVPILIFYAGKTYYKDGSVFLSKIGGKVLILAVFIFLTYSIISKGLSLLFGAEPGGTQELLTVPIQQLARVYTAEKDQISAADIATLHEILPESALWRYNPKVSDGVKIDFNNQAFAEYPAKYLKLWIKWGLRHPFTYINAWFMTSYGFWYPDTVIDVYRGNSVFTYTYVDSSYFGFEVEAPGVRSSKLPWLEEGYRRLSLEITQQKIPAVSMLFSPGFLFWIMMFTIGYLWVQKRYQQLVPLILPLLIWLTVILGPTYLVRYTVFLWALLPWLLITLFGGRSGGGRYNGVWP